MRVHARPTLSFLLLVLIVLVGSCKSNTSRRGNPGSAPLVDTTAAKQQSATYVQTPPENSWDDVDGDGLATSQEKICGTSADVADTDGDGKNDYDECIADTDQDGSKDSQEEFCGTDPTRANSNPQGTDEKAYCDGIIFPQVETVNPYAVTGGDDPLGGGATTTPIGTTGGDQADDDGDGLPAWQEADCRTSDQNWDSDNNGVSDLIDCTEAFVTDPPPGAEQPPQNLIRQFTFAIGGETSGSVEDLGRPLGDYNSDDGSYHLDSALCGENQILTGMKTCFHKYIEKVISIECATLKDDGTLIGHYSKNLNMGSSCDGVGAMESFFQGSPQNVPFSCNDGGSANDFITAFDGEVEYGANLMKLRLRCGRLTDNIAETFPELFQDERTGFWLGDEGLGSVCEGITHPFGWGNDSSTVEAAECPQNFVAVGLKLNWDSDSSANNCLASDLLATIHYFKLICKRITVYTEVVEATAEQLQCINEVGQQVEYNPACHNVIGSESVYNPTTSTTY